MKRASAAAALLALAACSGSEPPAAAPGVVSWHGERGRVTMEVRAAPAEVTVGERLRLSVTVRAPEGLPVTMPDPAPGEDLGPFRVRAAHAPPDVPAGDGMRLWEHAWELDTFAAGPAEVPPLTLRFGAPEETLASEPLAVEVRSVLAEGQDAESYRDIKEPVSLGGAATLAAVLAAAAIALALLAAAAFVLARRRRRARAAAAPPVPAHERALRELRALEAEDLPGRGAMHEYYFRLADIVRGYIERRFGLLAPERTTEEFLREARQDRSLTAEQKDMLGRFLRAADLVKFALHRPEPAEAASALAAARRFVTETAPRDADAAGAGGAGGAAPAEAAA